MDPDKLASDTPPAGDTPPAAGTAPAGGTPPAGGTENPPFFINPDGTYIPNFWDHPLFPQEHRGNLQLRTHTSYFDTLKDRAGLEAMRGYDKIPIPGEKSPPEVWDEAFNKLGRPASPDDYALPSVADSAIPQDKRMPDEMLTALKKGLHEKARLTQSQFTAAVECWNELIAGQLANSEKLAAQQAATDRETALQPLRAQWGADFDKNVANVETLIRSHIDPTRAEAFTRMIFADTPMIKFLAEIFDLAREARPELTGGVPGDALAAAEARLNELRANTKGPLYDADHPQHAQYQAEFGRLVALVNQAREPLGQAPTL